MGGGRIAHYLTAILERLGIHVKIIERSLDRCRHLSEVLPKATVICGDGTDQELLEEEDVTASDAFVALTDRMKTTSLSPSTPCSRAYPRWWPSPTARIMPASPTPLGWTA